MRALFAPYASLLAEFPGGACASLDRLNALAATSGRPPRSVLGAAIRFVGGAAASAAQYERRIRERGEVATRPGNWHDFLNALVWCAFPATKAALNARHCERIERDGAGRGRVRDALTLFDECGVLAVSCDAGLIDALRAHRWEEALWLRRDAVHEHMRFIVVGHATLDALRDPFAGLCAKVLYRRVPPSWLSRPPAAMFAEADDWLAHWFADDGGLSPASFAPLPLLGIPGVCAHNGEAAYYRDSSHFRPRRAPGLSGQCCV